LPGHEAEIADGGRTSGATASTITSMAMETGGAKKSPSARAAAEV